MKGSHNMRITMRSTAAVAVAITFATLAPGTAWAHQDMTGRANATANLGSTPFATKNYGPGVVSGNASLREQSGRLKIEAEVKGLKPGTTHIGHIHFGTRTSLLPGKIIFDLKPVKVGQNGEGRSVTVINDTSGASLAAVENYKWWVAFHEGPANSTPQSPAVAVGPVLLNQN